MKKIYFYLGKIGSGKSHVAKAFAEKLSRADIPHLFIEVSDLVKQTASEYHGPNPTREQLQALKEKLKANPNWLLDAILNLISRSNDDIIIISGLREKWILEQIEKKYGTARIAIVEADEELRMKRRQLSPEEFKTAEERDKKIGVDELIDSVRHRADVVPNNFERDSN